MLRVPTAGRLQELTKAYANGGKDWRRPLEVNLGFVFRFAGAPVGWDVPPRKRGPDGAPRWHTQAVLIFDVPVAGPVLLGAGRFRGWGVCRPLRVEDVAP